MNFNNLIYHCPTEQFIETPNEENIAGLYPTDTVHGIVDPLVEITTTEPSYVVKGKLALVHPPTSTIPAPPPYLCLQSKNTMGVRADIIKKALDTSLIVEGEGYSLEFALPVSEIVSQDTNGTYIDYVAYFEVHWNKIDSFTDVQLCTSPFTLRIRL